MKRTILPICGATLLILANLFAVSAQEVAERSKPNEANRGKFLEIPSKPMSIWSANPRRQIWAAILERDDKGIRIRKGEDNKEYHIDWDALDPNFVPLYKGEITFEEYQAADKARAAANTAARQQKLAEEKAAKAKKRAEELAKRTPRDYPELRVKISREEQIALREKFKNMGAAEVQGLLLKNDAALLQYIEQFDNATFQGWKHITAKSPWDLVRTMEIKPIVNEKVSLRPEFEKLGVRSKKQVGYSCIGYTYHNLFQYLAAKHHGVNPSIAAVLAPGVPDNRPNQTQCLEVFQKHNGWLPKMQELSTSIKALDIEILKHELRNGKPCTISWWNGGPHHSLAVGFEVKDGVTTFEILDTNGVENGGGYKTIPPGQGGQGNLSFSR